MNRSKRLFWSITLVFVLLLGWASYDISSRTTFPGSRPQLEERIKDNLEQNPVNLEDTLDKFSDSVSHQY